MKRSTAKVAGLAGAGFVGVAMAGALLAVAMPTSMKRAADDGASPFARSIDVSGSGDERFTMEVPPQDLSPAGWSGSGDLYPAAGQPDAWVQPVDSYDPGPSYADESYSDQMTEVALSDTESAPVDHQLARDDGAAASAEAASAAAADVRAVENAAVTPDAANDSVQPKAASATS